MTPPPNKNDQFDQDLEAIENAMNSMMQGTFSMVFKQLIDSSNGIFEQFPETTTIIDGKNVNGSMASIVEDEFGGSDFKRLANKSKQNRGLPIEQRNTEQNTVQRNTEQIIDNDMVTKAVGSIFNLLLHPEVTNPGTRANAEEIVARPVREQQVQEPTDKNNGGWSFTSTSQRTVYNGDGTQETIITKKSNGVTETIKQLHYPDGRIEESREQKNSIWNRLFGY